MSHRLALGTVQFGLPYGISNQTGQVSSEAAAAILGEAGQAGLDTLDTAIAYGESEQRLGEAGVDGWKIVSKLPVMPEGVVAREWVRSSVDESLARLGVPRLHGLLLHQWNLLLGPQGADVYRAMTELKAEGKVAKIGVSIYSPEDLDALWPLFSIDLVQGPFNVFDRRLLTTGWLDRMHQAGTEVHVRSVFLQGLLLMERASRPRKFDRWAPLWRQWHGWLSETGMSPLHASLGFALSQAVIDRVVVGVDTPTQLREILAVVGQAAFPPASLSVEDIDLINPSHWSLL